jgi:hypothetical protein
MDGGSKIARAEIATKAVVLRISGMEEVTVRRGVEYRTTTAGPLAMDVYCPPDWKSGVALPAVVFVFGYSDLGAEAMLGCKLHEMESYITWARLAA